MLKFKKGVKVAGLQPEALIAVDIAESVYSNSGRDCVITSARGDKHSAEFSRHYAGMAIDLRIRHLTAKQTKEIYAGLKKVLSSDYNVLLEASHIHVSYRPRYPGDV